VIAPIASTPEYERSVATFLVEAGGNGSPQGLISRPPRHDDSNLGPSLFRAGLEDATLASLVLPGLYVGRSVLSRVDFSGTDLRLAAFNWSGVLDCRFVGADLRGADLRSCRFAGCTFANADLRGADCRHSSFEHCVFTGAQMAGARLSQTRLLGFALRRPKGLCPEQAAVVEWFRGSDVPGGG